MRVTIICARCGATVNRRSSPSQPAPRYCSQQCWLKVHNSPERNAIVARTTVAQRAARQRDTGEGKTYRKWFGRHEHRQIMERIVGRRLTADEIVHHKDGNKRNNDPANLELTNRADHARHHFAEWRARAAKGGDAQPVP